MTKNIAIAAAALALAAMSSPSWARNLPTISANDLGAYCQQSGAPGSTDILVDEGHGTPVSVTIHCGANSDTEVGMNTDTGEAEHGPAEAAENGVED